LSKPHPLGLFNESVECVIFLANLPWAGTSTSCTRSDWGVVSWKQSLIFWDGSL